MANVPNVNKETYLEANNYLGTLFQNASAVEDFSLNSQTKEMITSDHRSGLPFGYGANGLTLAVSGVSTSGNFNVSSGYATLNGRVVRVPYSFEYTDHTSNYILTGEISTIAEVVAGVKYNITDSEKLLSSNYPMIGSYIRFTSGAESGNEFIIGAMSGQTLSINGDLSSVLAGDSYVIVPPRINSSALSVTYNVYLICWVEDISSNEDTNLQSALVPSKPQIHKLELRWCVYAGNYTPSNSTSLLTGFSKVLLGTATSTAGSNIVSSVENEERIGTLADIQAQVNLVEETLDANYATLSESDYEYTARGQNNLQVQESTVDIFPVDIRSSFIPEFIDTLEVASPSDIPPDSIALLNGPCRLVYRGGVVSVEAISDLDANDKTIIAFYNNESGSPDVIRSYPMLGDTKVEGFNYVIKDSGILSVNPGRLFRWGLWYELADLVNLDTSDDASYLDGVLPVSADYDYVNVYIYVRQTGSTKRSLEVFLDSQKPQWNGEHLTEKAFCIGIAYHENGSKCAPCRFIGDTLWLNLEIASLLAGDSGNNLTQELFVNAQRPLGTSMDIEVAGIFEENAERFLEVSMFDSALSGTNDTDTFRVILPGFIPRSIVSVPIRSQCQVNMVQLTTSEYINAYLRKVVYNRLNPADSILWR